MKSAQSTLHIWFRLFVGLVFVASATVLFSCEKYVTPNKVIKKISVDSWQITQFVFQDTTITNEFMNVQFGFGEDGPIVVIGQQGVSGNWSVGENKEPTVLYISSFLQDPFFKLNDDWTVTTCSKSTIRLESENGSFTNQITLQKVES